MFFSLRNTKDIKNITHWLCKRSFLVIDRRLTQKYLLDMIKNKPRSIPSQGQLNSSFNIYEVFSQKSIWREKMFPVFKIGYSYPISENLISNTPCTNLSMCLHNTLFKVAYQLVLVHKEREKSAQIRVANKRKQLSRNYKLRRQGNLI